MKIFIKTIAANSFCYSKISEAIKRFSPSNYEFINNPKNADLFILFINGRFHHFTLFIEEFKKPYVVFQSCIRSTRHKHTSVWRYMWENAKLVWSYYPLNKYIKDDGGNWSIPNFYHSPLGADETIFTMDETKTKRFITMSSGWDESLDNNSEHIKEVHIAAGIAQKEVFHLGKFDNHPPHVFVEHNISDHDLALRYQECHSVVGLRKIEAFEMPLIEGLFCGIRPIVFDRPHYRLWHDQWGIFIPESSPGNIITNLLEIFNNGIQPITKKEREEAVSMFNWKKIINGFWERLK